MLCRAPSAAVRPPTTPSTPDVGIDPEIAVPPLAGGVRSEHALIIGANALVRMCAPFRKRAAKVSLRRQDGGDARHPAAKDPPCWIS